LGEPKYKLTLADFIKEYATNGRTANAKYSGAVVELTGNVIRSAGPEVDGLGGLVGKPGEYKAFFVFGEPDSKRFETVEVRGLKLSVVGTVMRGQQVQVRGRVAKYQQPNPVELLDAEVVKRVADTSVEFSAKALNDAKPGAKFETTTATFSGIVVGELKTDDGEYIEVKGPDATVRCYLMEGVRALFPSGFPKEMRIMIAGNYRGAMKNESSDTYYYILRDCVPLYRDPKATW
jgi:hypothetical protein